MRRNTVFATDITSSLRLRRWMAATCASVAMSHLYWLLLYYNQADSGDPTSRILLCRILDILFNWSVTFYTMLVMLQDRRRPLWYAVVYVALGLAVLLSDTYYQRYNDIEHHDNGQQDAEPRRLGAKEIFHGHYAMNEADDNAKISLLDSSLTESLQCIIDITSRYIFETNVFEKCQDKFLMPDD
ncbi:MAG: hypothetical protein K6E45_02725, partial [Bacteroidaceae bacterium]|nr:hypothetical protein [Bacteroidaceae bacterium]